MFLLFWLFIYAFHCVCLYFFLCILFGFYFFFFFSSRRRHTRWTGDWSSDVCSSDLVATPVRFPPGWARLDASPRPTGSATKSITIGMSEVASFAACAAKGVKRSEKRRVGKECRSRWAAYH